MTEAVLDASVVLKWFGAEAEPNDEQALTLRARLLAGTLSLVSPSLLRLELLNVAGRRWGYGETQLLNLAAAIDDLGFEFREPGLVGVAVWTGRGLTAYDASHVALAEKASLPLITDDRRILGVAGDVAFALARAAELP